MTIPRISTPSIEGPFQAAKWLKIQALLDPQELVDLLSLGGFLYPLSGLYKPEELIDAKGSFLKAYAEWIEQLKSGFVPHEAELRKYSAIAWVCNAESLWLQEVPQSRYMVKVSEPIVQIQVHQMSYSSIDGEFRPMVMSRESIFWGLQFSFPQIYQDPKSLELLEVEAGSHLELFQQLRRWMRENTAPTPMMVEGKRKNLPIRLGKKCFSWVNRHPQLVGKGLSVLERNYAQ